MRYEVGDVVKADGIEDWRIKTVTESRLLLTRVARGRTIQEWFEKSAVRIKAKGGGEPPPDDAGQAAGKRPR